MNGLNVIIMLSTGFRVNLHFLVALMSMNVLHKTDVVSEV